MSNPDRPQKAEIIMPDQYADRRSEPRMECDDRGALLFLSTHKMVPCRILDQSASGARVSMAAIGDLPAEIWLIDLDQNSVRCGKAAWSMPNRMGLKFSFVTTLSPGEAKPAKVPQEVFDAWKRLTGQEDNPDQDDDDVLYFD